MIKFAGHDPASGRPVLGIGLSRDNCNRLLEGQPIAFTTEGMGLPELEVCLLAGETEEAIANDMLKMGAITPDPHVRIPDKGAN